MQNKEYIERLISLVDFVFTERMTCGIKAMVVPAAAKKPIIFIKSIYQELTNWT